MASKKIKTCQICKSPFQTARRDAKTCSPACRKQLQRRLQAQASQRAERLESALGREFHRLASNLFGQHVIHEPLVLADERGGVPASVLEPPTAEVEPQAPAVAEAPAAEPVAAPEPAPESQPAAPVTEAAPVAEPESLDVPVNVIQQPPMAEAPAETAAPAAAETPAAAEPAAEPAVEPVAEAATEPTEATPTEAMPGASGADADALAAAPIPDADESLEAPGAAEDPFAAAAGQPPEDDPKARKGFSPFALNRAALMVTTLALMVVMVIGGTSFLFLGKGKKGPETASDKVARYAPGSKLPLSGISNNPQLAVGQADSVTVNGELKVSKSLVLAPSSAPSRPEAGQIYFDQGAKAPFYYDGSQFISLAPQAIPAFPQHVDSIGGATGVIDLGNSLSMVNNQLAVSDAVLNQINTVSGSYVRSLTGTANQVIVSSSTGNVKLSLPQSIATSSTPTFGGLTLNGGLSVTSGGATIAGNVRLSSLGLGLVQSDSSGLLSSGAVDRNDSNFLSGTLSVANGGTGAGSFTANGILYGNGTGAIQVTNSLANAALVTNGSGVPTLSQTLPLQVQDNLTHTGVLVSGSINNGFGAISTVNNITTSALVQAGSLEVDGGSFTVDNAGNFVAYGTGNIRAAGGLTIGVANSTTGSLVLADAGSAFTTTVQAVAQAGQDQTIIIPASSTASDEFCLMTLGNCVGTGGSVVASGGVQNYITKFTNASGNQIGNSLLYDNGVSVGVGTATPGASYLLDLNGNLHVGGSSTLDNTLTVTAGGANITGNISQSGSGTLSTGTGAVSLNGNTSVTGSNTFSVGTGAATFGGTLGVTSGLTTLSGGLTVTNGATITGFTNINVSGTANTFIGNASGSFGLTSTGLNVTTGGALSGITGYSQASGNFAQSGTGSFGTGTGAVSLNGATTVTNGSLTVGSAGTTAGSIYLANASSSREVVLQGLNPTGTGNATIQFPSIAGGSTDTVCLVGLNNCAAAGPAGGDLTGTYPNPTIAKLQGTTLTLSSLASGDVLQYNGSAIVNGHITNNNLTAGTFSNITGTGALTSGSIGVGFGDINIGSSVFTGDGSGLTNLNGSNIATGTVDNARLVNGGALTVTAGTGLTGGGSVALGNATTLSVAYGAVAGTAVQGDTALVCPTGTGNLTGGGNSITLGTGGTCGDLTITDNPDFIGTLTVEGSGGIMVGVTGVTDGVIKLANSTNSNLSVIQSSAPTGTGNATYTLPAIAGGSSDTICLFGLSNCSATGSAGGDLTGSYPNPTIASLQGTTLTLSSLASGDVLQYNGSAIVNGHITNNNLTAGTFSNITGTGALTSGSIASGFGSISTGNNITTTATVQGATLNATGAIQLNGTDINTAGTLSNVAYLNQANNFTASQTISANGGKTTLALTSTGSNIGITIGGDTNLYRSATSTLRTDGAFVTNGQIVNTGTGSSPGFQANKSAANVVLQNLLLSTDTQPAFKILGDGTINWGAGGSTATDTNLYRSAADTLKTDDSLVVTGTLTSGLINGQTISSAANFTGTLAVQGSTVTIGSAGATAGSLLLANASNSNLSIISASAPSGSGDATYTLPSIAGGSSDTVCLVTLGNCAGSGGGIVGSGTTGQLAVFTGSGSIGDSVISQSGSAVTVAGTLAVTGANSLSLGSSGANTGSVKLYNSTNSNTLTLQAGATASNLTLTLPTADGGNGDCLLTNGAGVLDFGACTGGAGGGVTSLDGRTGVLTLANSSGAGGTITIDNASTSQKGIAQFNSTNFTASSGTINTIQDIATGSTPNFAGVILGNPGSTTGNLYLANSTSSREVVLQGLNPTGTGNATIQIPSIAGGSTDMVCLQTLSNCTAIGAAGGDLTGTYPNPTIASLQGTTLTLSSLATGDVLQYNGSAIVNGKITDTNLQGGTYASITGVGALTSGSIASGFGSISTGNNITTTATVQGGIVNATSAIQLNGTDINTAGTLSNVAYLNQANNFTAANTFTAGAASTVPITVKANASQSADLLDVMRSSDSAARVGVDSTGRLLIGNGSGTMVRVEYGNGGATLAGRLSVGNNDLTNNSVFSVTPGTASTIAQIIRGIASQTADLLQLQNSSGTVLSHFDSAGKLALGTSAAPGNTLMVNNPTTADSTAAALIATGGASNKGLVIQGAASQTGNALQVQTSAGGVVSGFNAGGGAFFGTTGSFTNTTISLITGATTNIGMVLRGVASQTADLLQLQDSSSTVLSHFDSAGKLIVGSSANSSGGVLTVGTNTTTNAGGIYFGTDTTLYRATTSTLKTDSEFRVSPAKTDLSGSISSLQSLGTFNPASDNGSALFMIGINSAPQYISTTTKTVGGSALWGIYSNPQVTSSGSLSAVYGVDAQIQTNTGSTATITNGIGLRTRTPSVASGSTITNAYGLQIQTQGTTGVNNAIGIDVAAQTGAATSNIGVRIAKGDTYTLQLSDTGGSAAGGIEFGTDTSLYRSAAAQLTTNGQFRTFGATTSSSTLSSAVTGDANARFLVRADGKILWGDGTATQDTNLYRSTTGTLKTDSNFVIGGSQFTNNASTLNGAVSLGDFPTGGSIGSAASTVDITTTLAIAQTTAGQTLSLPSPTVTTAGRVLYVLNTGSASFTMSGVTIPSGYGQIYIWNGSSWILGASGGGSAITLQSAYDGGNTLTTSNGRDISVTLADTSTDANFVLNVVSGSTGQFKVQNNGSDVLAIGSAGQLALAVQGSGGGLLIGGDATLYRSAVNTLTAQTLNTTTGLNTGAGAGTQRLDASGNLVNIASLTGSGALTVDASGANTISLGATSTGDILLGGGSGSTGCTVTNATGAFACTSTINGATLTGGSLSSSAVNGLSVSGGTITNPTIAGTITGSGSPTITGFGTISAGTYNGQTISSTANFTGTVAIQGASSLTLGTSSSNTGSAKFLSASGTGSISLVPANPSSTDYTLTLPAENGTLCSTGSICAGYAAATGGNYIAKNAQDTSTASVTGNLLSLTNTSTGAAGVLSLTNSGTSPALSITQTGTTNPTNFILANNNTTTPSGNLLALQNKGTNELTVDVSGNLVSIGNLQGVNITSTGSITVGTLGTTNTSTLLCRNASNIIAGCATTGTGAAFVQGGNSFGTTATLGTTDNNGLNIITNNTTVASLSSTGAALFKNSTDSTTAFQIQNTGGTSLLTADTANQQLTVTKLQSTGDISIKGPDGGSILIGAVANSGTGSAMTFSGNEINDKNRAIATQGDGLQPPDSSTGIWEGTTNLLTNGGFESNTTGWVATTVSGDAAISRDTTLSKFGSASSKVTGSTGTLNGMRTSSSPYSPSTTYTVSGWFYIQKVGSGVTNISLVGTYNSGPQTTTSSNLDLTKIGQWQKATITFTTNSGSQSGTYVDAPRISGTQTSQTIVYSDGLQVEAKPTATPYVETNGTTATRNAARVQVPSANLNTNQGWFAARVRMNWASASGDGSSFPAIFDWRNDGSNRYSVFWNQASARWEINSVNGGVSTGTNISSSFNSGDYATVIAYWTGSGIAISVNGSNFATISSGTRPTISAATADIATVAGTGSFLDSDIMWSAAGSGTLSNADAAALNRYGNNDPSLSGINSIDTASTPTYVWNGESTAYASTSNVPTLQSGITLDDATLYRSGAGAIAIQGGTNSTTAFQIQNSSGTSIFTADTTNQRVAIGPSAVPANGVLTIGTNTTGATGGLYFGTDTNLYRSASGRLRTDGIFDAFGAINSYVSGDTNPRVALSPSTAGIIFGPGNTATDTNLYRSTTSTLKTDGNFIALGHQAFGANTAVSTTNVLSVGETSTNDSTSVFGIGSAINYNGTSNTDGNGYAGVNGAGSLVGTGSITNLSGVRGKISSTGAGTITNARAFWAVQPTISAGSITNAIGLSVNNQGASGVTNAIGIDVSAQTGAATSNIGVRIAKGDTYALQLSDTGGTSAGGITFGTDTNLYRSAANTLKTDSNLVVAATSTATSGNVIGSTLNLTASPSSSATGFYYGSQSTSTYNGTASTTGSAVGAWNRGIQNAGSGVNVDTVYGTYGQAIVQAAGTVNILAGVNGIATNLAASTGTVTSAIGLRAQVQNNSTAGAAYTQGYGVLVNAPIASATGTIGTDYGVYIAKQNGTGITTAYGLYQADSGDLNYLAGNTGVGTTPNANYKLNVQSLVTDPAAAQNGIRTTLTSTQTGANSQNIFGNLSLTTINGSGGNSGTLASYYGETHYNNSGSASGTLLGTQLFAIQDSSGGGVATAVGLLSRVDNNSTNAITTAYGLQVANNAGTGSITNNVGLRIAPLSGTSTAYGIQVAAPTGATTKAAINLSDTGGTSAGGLLFGTDTSLYRSAAGELTTNGDLVVQGGDITTNQTTFNLLNTTATTLNIGGAATTLNLAGGSGSTGCTIDGSGNLTCTGNVTGTSSGTMGYWSRSGTTLQPANSGDNITTSGNISTSGSGTITSAGLLTGSAGATISGAAISLNDSSNFATNINTGSSTGTVTVGNSSNTTALNSSTTTFGGQLLASNSATATTGTTTGTGTNTTTLTLTSDAFNVNDVVFIDNAGQDYYTRITADPGTGSYTVSPAVTFETGRTVTKYNIQNIGATSSDYTTQANRFFQGYFLGGIVAGAGSTIYGDSSITMQGDTNLYRSAADVLSTDDTFKAGFHLLAGGVLSTGNLTVDTTRQLNVTVGASTRIGQVIKGAASQSADLLQLQDSSANVLSHFDASGNLVVGSSASAVAVLNVGTNTTANTGGIEFGTDTNLYRSGSNQLKTDGSFVGGSTIIASGTGSSPAFEAFKPASSPVLQNFLLSSDTQPALQINGDGKLNWGAGGASATDTNLYRVSSGILRTDGSLGVNGSPNSTEQLKVTLASGKGTSIGSCGNDGTVAVFVCSVDTTQKTLALRDVASQSADLLSLQNSSGTVLSHFDASGNLIVGSNSTITSGVAYFNGNVGIGTNNPGAKLQVTSGLSPTTPTLDAGTLLSVNTASSSGNFASIDILAGSSGTASLYFGSGATENKGSVRYDNSANSLTIGTNGTARTTIDSSGNLTQTGDVTVQGGDLITNQTTATLFNSTATTLSIGGATTTLNLAGGSSSSGCTIDGSGNLTCTGGFNGNGYATSNTSNTDAGHYTKLATCTLTAQFQDCRSQALIVNQGDGGTTPFQANVDFRVKQQNAMAAVPFIEVTASNMRGFTPSQFIAVTTTNDAGSTVVELWGQINTSFQQWRIAPQINTGSVQASWLSSQGFSASLPAGTQTTATLLDDQFNSIKIAPSANSTTSFLLQDASSNSLFTADTTNEQITLGITGSSAPVGLSVPGTGTANASTPDSAATSITGDIDLIAKLQPNDWSPTTNQMIISKNTTSSSQVSYQLFFNGTTTGRLTLGLSNNGTAFTNATSSAAPGFVNGTTHWVRATWRASDGRVQFFRSEDGSTWTQVGTDQTISNVTVPSIFDGTANVNIGASTSSNNSNVFSGTIYRAKIYNGFSDGGGTLAADFNPADAANTAATSWTSSATGETWTVNGTARLNSYTNTVFGPTLNTIAGATQFRNASDSTTAFQIQNAGGTSILTVDTANSRVAIGPSAVPANGVLTIGTNTTAASGGLYFGTDTNLYRSTTSTLKTDGSFVAVGNISLGSGSSGYIGSTTAAASTTQIFRGAVTGDTNNRYAVLADGTINWGSGSAATDTNLYRSAAATLKTDGTLQATTFAAGPNVLVTGTTASIRPTDANTVGLVLRGQSSQASDLLQFQNSSGTVLTTITAAGVVQGGNGSGTNNGTTSPQSLVLAGGRGTGSGNGGNVNLQIAAPGASGSSLNNLATVASLSGADGSALFKNATDSVTAFRVQNASSSTVFDVNTSNGRVGIGNAAPSYTLDVSGDINSSGSYRAGGTAGISATCAGGETLNGIAVSGGIVTAGTCTANGADLAEAYNSTDSLQAGELVMVDPSGDGTSVLRATGGSDALLGVVSTHPDHVMGTADVPNGYPIALNGRVPVKVNDEGGAIAPGDKITLSSVAGVGMRANGAGMVVGTALTGWSGSGEGTIEVFVHVVYYQPPVQGGSGSGSAGFSDINVSGTATINNLQVTSLNATSASLTTATIGTLTVTSSAEFRGDLTIDGHVITAGGQPTSVVQTAAGGSGATVAVDGTDTTGTITITTGSAPTAGDLAKILFSKQYGAAPHIVLSPSNDKAAGLRFFKGTTSTTDFMFNALDTPAANTTYTFDYFIAQ